MAINGEGAVAQSRLPKYAGPEFDEFCISENRFLHATRDRAPCLACPLCNLCQAGFEEQARRASRGENPSLTEDKVFIPELLTKERLFAGLSPEEANFVVEKVPGL
jgi:hypothetical protein